MTASSELVTLKGGHVVNWTVVQRLLTIEGRGCHFKLLDAGRFRVDPPSVLTPDDVAFLRQHRDEMRHVLVYCEQMAEAPC